MLNGLDPSAPRFLADLDRIQERSLRAERQISSGLRVESASDDPGQVIEILRLKSRLANNSQLQTNLTRVQSQVNTAEAAMRQAVSLMERARTLAAENASTGAPNRTTMAIEARQLHDQLVALVSTAAQGEYVFNGDGPEVAPYVSDWTQPAGVRFVGSSATNSTLVTDENGTTFTVSKTASELFDAPGSNNAFQALFDLTKALENDSESDVAAVAPKIVSVLDHLNGQLAFYGNAQNRVSAAFDAAQKSSTAMKGDLSRLEEADIPAAILELNSSKIHLEAALSAHAQTSKATLFDFLG
jgi:flagellar hook-associated protein 3 FlgL